MKTKLLFIIIPLSLLLVFNYSLSNWKHINNSWYNGLNKFINESKELNILFIGSSRVAAAVDEYHFKELYQNKFKQSIEVYNLGKGFSTIKQNYFLLRNLLEIHPNKLKNLTVFLEAPDGIPELVDVEDKWFHHEQPAFLIDVLQTRDLIPLVKSKLDLNSKIQIILKYMMKSFLPLRYQETIRNGLLANGMKLFKKVIPIDTKSTNKVADLVTHGDIRNDLQGVKRIRSNALKHSLSRIKNQKPSPNYTKSTIFQIENLFKKHGIKLVLFHMPVSSIYQNENKTRLRLQERKLFNQEISKHQQIQILKTITNFSDRAFPDMLHLAKSKRIEFTGKIFTSFY